MIGPRLALIAPLLTFGTPAVAQMMPGMDMTGMAMRHAPASRGKTPATKPRKPAARPSSAKPTHGKPDASRPPAAKPAPDHRHNHGMTMPGMVMPADGTADDHAVDHAVDHGAMPGMTMPADPSAPMAGMAGMAHPDRAASGTDLPAGNAPAPLAPTDLYAARFFPPGEIGRAHATMMREQGGRNFAMVLVNLAEYQARRGGDGLRWDGEAWFGGDINRFTLKTEGEATLGQGVDAAEVQALYSRAIGPYFNVQAGIRHDFAPTPSRTYATIGFEGLAPYQFEVDGALFLSDRGDVLGRLTGYYDQRITQRLILQPRVELNLAAQDMPANRIGAGLSNVEFGVRLRYELAREFAPYVGVSYEARTGRTADYARANGDRATSTSLVTGVRFWF